VAFDVFLSHSAADQPAVARLADLLRARGLRPWLDVEQVVPGVRFQPGLAAGLAASRSFGVFVGGEEVGAWVAEELDAAVDRAVGDPSFRVFLVLLPGAPDPFDATGLHGFLGQRTWVDLRRLGDRPERAGDLLARAVRGEPLGLVDHAVADEGAAPVCPYVGLRAFRPDEGGWFFGRDADVQRVVEKLRTAGLVAVLGRSGVGKSSLVRAGVVPALAAGRVIPGSERWRVRLLRPTAAPLEELAAHVGDLRPDLSPTAILAELAASGTALRLLTAGRHGGDEPVLWVVDQAEELFTLAEAAADPAGTDPSGTVPEPHRAFAANLLHASQAGGPARVVVAARADFYPRFAEVPGLGARMAQSQHVVAELAAGQLRDVITAPAALVGASFEPGLVERIVDDVRSQTGALPLLQHALRELWGHRSGSVLTHDAYDEIGGVYGALTGVADAVLDDLAATGDEPTARRLLVELVRLGEGAEDTRQPVRLSDIASPGHPFARLQAVAARLADARLVTTDGDGAAPGTGGDAVDEGGVVDDVTVELVHDAVIRSWPRLRGWLEQSRDELRAARRIRDAARAWRDEGRPDDLLYRGSVLAGAREGAGPGAGPGAVHTTELPELSAEFLAASTAREDADQRRSRTRRTRVLGALGTLTVLMLVAAVGATGLFVQARAARHEAEESTARALVQQARALAPEQPALALAVAAEAYERLGDRASADTLQLAHVAFGEAPGHVERVLSGHEGHVTAVAYDPAGTRVATAGHDRTVRLWDPSTGRERRTLRGHDDWVVGVAFSPDGTTVATAGRDRTARLWDVATGRERRTLRGHDEALTAVAFQPGGTRLATAGRDATVKLWDPATGAEVASITPGDGWVLGLAFSTDGTRLATAGRDGTVRIWDATTQEEVTAIDHAHDAVTAVAFDPDGRRLATTGRNGRVRIWDATTGGHVALLASLSRWQAGLAFSPDGTRLAAAGADGQTRMWDVDSRDEVATLAGHGEAVSSVAFSPAGDQLATTGEDGTTRLWNPGRSGELTRLAVPEGELSSVGFGADGTRVVTAGADGVARLWDAATGEQLRAFPSPGKSSGAAAIDGSGETVATGGTDGIVRLWDTGTGQQLQEMPGHADAVVALAFAPDGRTLATASLDETARLWDVRTGEEIHALRRHRHQVLAVDFSPDGDHVATAGIDQTLKVWDVASGRQELSVTRPSVAVAYSPDGAVIATDDVESSATLWDASTGEELHYLRGHDDLVWAVDFAPDGDLVATGSLDGTARLWDAATGEGIVTLPGHDHSVTAVAFSPDGAYLATADEDGTALVRHLVLTPADACAVVALEVTRAELVTALGGESPRACTDLP
jgi:WD40 repeat protein